MKNLNREIFFNEMKQKYPNAMSEFLRWIDKYAETNEWHKMFQSGIGFYELTLDMQMGLFSAFLFPRDVEQQSMSIAKTMINGAFNRLETKLKTIN